MPGSPAADAVPCQIYAVLEVGPGATDRLAALLAAYDLAAVLIVAVAGQSLSAQAVKPLVDLAQRHNAAALIADDVALARTLRADGVHLGPGDDLMMRYETARETVGAGAIVGVDAGGSRHLAMEAGEAGADYVGFSRDGAPQAVMALDADGTEADGSNEDGADVADLGPRTRTELLSWWAEVFEVPCVGFGAVTVDEVVDLAAAGAEFVAVRFGGGEAVGEAVARLRAMAAAVEADDAA